MDYDIIYRTIDAVIEDLKTMDISQYVQGAGQKGVKLPKGVVRSAATLSNFGLASAAYLESHVQPEDVITEFAVSEGNEIAEVVEAMLQYLSIDIIEGRAEVDSQSIFKKKASKQRFEEETERKKQAAKTIIANFTKVNGLATKENLTPEERRTLQAYDEAVKQIMLVGDYTRAEQQGEKIFLPGRADILSIDKDNIVKEIVNRSTIASAKKKVKEIETESQQIDDWISSFESTSLGSMAMPSGTQNPYANMQNPYGETSRPSTSAASEVSENPELESALGEEGMKALRNIEAGLRGREPEPPVESYDKSKRDAEFKKLLEELEADSKPVTEKSDRIKEIEQVLEQDNSQRGDE